MKNNNIIGRLPTSKHVLVIGDVMLDEFIYGEIEKVNPEASAHVVNVKKRATRAGGAANVAVNLSKFCEKVSIVGRCGSDSAGLELKQILERNSVDCYFYNQDVPTIKKTRVLAGEQQICRFDEEIFVELDFFSRESAFLELLNSVDLVILSDYAKGALVECSTIIEKCQTLGIPVLVDPKGRDFKKYSGSELIKPNLKEFLIAANLSETMNPFNLEAEILNFHKSLDIKYLLVTCGSKGMLLSDKEKIFSVPTQASKIYDVTGAGDSVIAALASVYFEPANMVEKIEFSNLVAGISVGEPGTYAVTLEDVSKFSARGAQIKRIRTENISDFVNEFRGKGKKIVFTNGCFDLLHRGHIHSLKAASALGDILIVGLNSDSSIQENKGPLRPIQSFEDRCAVLESMEFVDAVVGFDEKTPIELIKAIRPDILVKGSDYQSSEVVGSEFLAPDGEIHLIDLIDGVSTTKTISKIRGI